MTGLVAIAASLLLTGCSDCLSGPVLKYRLNMSDAARAVYGSLTEPFNEEATEAETSETPAADGKIDNNTVYITVPDTSTVMLPVYEGEPYELVNNNVPDFTDADYEKASKPFEYYTDLDSLGRCGMVEACIVPESMPTKKRGDIGYIKPTGWKQAKYAGIAEDGSYDKEKVSFLMNRSHLLAYMLGGAGGDGSDDIAKNLISGTRYMNCQGQLRFENKIANYIRDTGNAVLYRITPVFNNNELMARGVMLEAASVEDRGQSLSFNVYVFNVQPGIHIDYETGDSYAEDGSPDLYAGKG